MKKWVKKNYFLLIFVGCIGFVGMVVFYKLFVSKPTYIYAKVKVGQGAWWANTQKPNLWFVRAISQAKEQKDITGTQMITIINVDYYPYIFSQILSNQLPNQYDIYVTMKLKVSSTGAKKTYNFNRETIGVSSPINLEFPNVQFSGTVIALDDKPFKEIYEEKIVYLTKRIPLPWEYEQITVGDSQMRDGTEIFKVLDKSYEDESVITLVQNGILTNSLMNSFSVKARIRVKKEGNEYVFGEEYVVAPGRILQGVEIKDFTFIDYYITKIE